MPTDPQHPDLNALLNEFFTPGVEAADVPALLPLLKARVALNAFVTLFRGGEEEVLVRLLVLKEIGARAEAPRWGPQELARHFAYLDPVKLDTVLKRLREYGLLVWDPEERVYQLSASGRVALSALAPILQFALEEDAELGYVTSQLAASQVLGEVSQEVLLHVLASLNELQNEFDQAVLAGSEFRLRRAQERLASVWKYVEQGTELVRAIASRGGELDTARYRVAQAIGQAQSRMMRMAGIFQRELASLERQRVHLGESGVSSTDIAAWLRTRTREALAGLAQEALAALPQPLFVTPNEMLDCAEYELLEREREKAVQAGLPPPGEVPVTDQVEPLRLELLGAFLTHLDAIEESAELAEAVVGGGYAEAAYRLSLLALLGDRESGETLDPAAALARLPLALTVAPRLTPVGRDGVESVSEGRIARVEN